jgi:hypothetical protein
MVTETQIKEVTTMSEKEKEILETFGKIIPDLTEIEKERLLAFGEGIAFKNEQLKATSHPKEKKRAEAAAPPGA